ncbi:zinc finger HIT domain-containing protein 2 isoform X2 [Adelges cooleyi]|uniref:zinc finger HIT domain-containing protein 2 isoform X2 n=1 Tax=Adelges cooleyi TaxID=133065 RepID=UPI00217FE89A|nr:zinc finger HIT domain-containing protein 2 isoform X2 [Adelges cooleyi]
MSQCTSVCKFCTESPSRYVCPKCGAPYCSLSCYKSNSHLECTEQFYKECIGDELSIQDPDQVGQKEMLDILKRVYGENEDSATDSDDEDYTDLNQRLNGIDLDDAELVWNHLTDSEKAEFEHLVKSGDITKVLPQYIPWWCLPIEKKLVSELGEDDDSTKFPLLFANIPSFTSISKKPPSDCVQWNLVNILTSYVFLIRYYNGKHKSYLSEFINGIYNLSLNLLNNQNFESYDTAVKSVELCILEHEMFKDSEGSFNLITEDLEAIFNNGLQSNCNHNVKLALSDLHRLLSDFKNHNKYNSKDKVKLGDFNKKFPDSKASYSITVDTKKARLLLKKIEYFLSWANEVRIQEATKN